MNWRTALAWALIRSRSCTRRHDKAGNALAPGHRHRVLSAWNGIRGTYLVLCTNDPTRYRPSR